MPWRVRISERATKELDNLPEREREAVERAMVRMETDLSGLPLRKLGGRGSEWRLRVGRWRLRLQFDTASGTIHVLRVLDRKDAYRG